MVAVTIPAIDAAAPTTLVNSTDGEPVRPAEVPEVFWLPEAFTPGRVISPVPLKDTPPIFLAVSNAVAVSALPVVSWFRVATRAAATVPEAMLEPLIAVMLAPLPTNPPLAVTIPAAAILPLAYMVAAVPTLRPPVAVATPVILTLLKNVAGVPVWILSVDATPVNPVPSPVNDVAVTIPENVALPLADIVAADPTLRPSVRVAIPDAIFRPNVVICIPLVAVTIHVEYMSVTTS